MVGMFVAGRMELRIDPGFVEDYWRLVRYFDLLKGWGRKMEKRSPLFFKTVNTPRNIWSGCFYSSGVAGGLLFLSLLTGDRGGPGMPLIIAVGLIACPVIFILIYAVCIIPWYWMLLDLKRLSFVALYLASAITAFLLWLLLAVASGITPKLHEIQVVAFVVGILFLVLVSLFWLFSQPGKLNDEQG